jgi:FMN reductase
MLHALLHLCYNTLLKVCYHRNQESSMSILVISTSLNPGSRSRVMAKQAVADLQISGVATDWLDLQDSSLPMCDGGAAYGHASLSGVKQQIINATGVIMAVPIYTFDVSAAAKNLIEMTGRDCWTEKVVGFICAAGGQGSYMSIMQLANSLMLDFRTFIVPRFVYATKDAFAGDVIADEVVKQRIAQLSHEVVRVSEALCR